ncbi:hypothetical protein D3C71_2232360 [compost metagenome]
MAFPVSVNRVKQRFSNGIGQAIDSRLQRIVFHLKIESRAVRCGAGIMAAAVFFQEFGKIVRLGIAL